MITKEYLEQYVDMACELPELEKKISDIEKKIEKIEKEGCVKDTVTGGNGGTQHFVIEGFPVPEYRKQRTRLFRKKMEYENLRKRVEKCVDDIESFLIGVDNSRIRRIINYKYIEGLSWYDTADKIGKTATSESVRKELERYLDKEFGKNA